MPHYEMIAREYEHKGKKYKKGDVIETPVDLEKKWGRGKFRRVFPLPNGGGHVPVASVIQTPAGETPPAEPAKGAKVSKSAKVEADVAAANARGADVTKDFPSLAAHQEGFKVFQRGELFHVYVGDAVKAIHPAGLKKTDVDATVTHFLDG